LFLIYILALTLHLGLPVKMSSILETLSPPNNLICLGIKKITKGHPEV